MNKKGFKAAIILVVISIIVGSLLIFAACDSKEKDSPEDNNPENNNELDVTYEIYDYLTNDELGAYLGYVNSAEKYVSYGYYSDYTTPWRFWFYENESVALELYVYDSEEAASEVFSDESAMDNLHSDWEGEMHSRKIGNKIIFEQDENYYENVILTSQSPSLTNEQWLLVLDVFNTSGLYSCSGEFMWGRQDDEAPSFNVDNMLTWMGSGVTEDSHIFTQWSVIKATEEQLSSLDRSYWLEGSYIKPYADGYYATKLIINNGAMDDE